MAVYLLEMIQFDSAFNIKFVYLWKTDDIKVLQKLVALARKSISLARRVKCQNLRVPRVSHHNQV